MMSKHKEPAEIRAVYRQTRIWLTDFRLHINTMIDKHLEHIDQLESQSVKKNGSTTIGLIVDDGAKDAV